MLSKETILTADDRKVEPLTVPEWGGDVYLRVMTGTERDELERSMVDPSTGSIRTYNTPMYRARFAALVLSDEKGNRLFSDADVPALSAKSAPALDRILGAGMVLNGFTGAAVNELEKNCETSPSDGSGSS